MSILKAAINDLLNNRELSVGEAADRHFAPSFRQRTNGKWDDRATVVARLSDLRSTIRHAEVTVLDEFVEGPRYAERHLLELERHEGGLRHVEVYVFAERDRHGRFLQIEELTLAQS